MTDKITFDENGYMEGTIPEECVKDCSHPGDCLPDVIAWLDVLDFDVPSNLARDYLQDFGAWEDLDSCSQAILNQRILWLACCEIAEEGDWLGLVH